MKLSPANTPSLQPKSGNALKCHAWKWHYWKALRAPGSVAFFSQNPMPDNNNIYDAAVNDTAFYQALTPYLNQIEAWITCLKKIRTSPCKVLSPGRKPMSSMAAKQKWLTCQPTQGTLCQSYDMINNPQVRGTPDHLGTPYVLKRP